MVYNKKDLAGRFSMYDFRVFGHGKGKLPPEVESFKVNRKEDCRRFYFSWNKSDRATGYIIHWGVKRDQLKNASMVMNESRIFQS